MMIGGRGWSITDLGVDVGSERFIEAIENNPGAVVGLSALLTTTMQIEIYHILGIFYCHFFTHLCPVTEQLKVWRLSKK